MSRSAKGFCHGLCGAVRTSSIRMPFTRWRNCSRPGHRSFVHGELLVQGEVLQGELAVAAAEEREEAKQVEQEGDHRAVIVAGSELTVHPLARRRNFGEGQANFVPRDREVESTAPKLSCRLRKRVADLKHGF